MLSTQDQVAAPDDLCFREIEPAGAAAAATELLTQSFSPPCLRYSQSYLRWQLTFPGPRPTRTLVACDGSTIVGFVAAIPRAIRMQDAGVVSLLSFLAIHPKYRNSGIGRSMLRHLLEVATPPAFAYTIPGASAERLLTASVQARRWTLRRLGEFRTYLFVDANDMDSSTIAREATVDEFYAARTTTPSGVAWSHPTIEQTNHYATDPRGACLAIVEGPDGIVGSGLIVRSEVLTASGAETVPSLDCVYLRQSHAAPALAALGRFALKHWTSDETTVVTAPNLHAVPASAIRAAGFRATRSVFNLNVVGEASDPVVQQITSTNLEVV